MKTKSWKMRLAVRIALIMLWTPVAILTLIGWEKGGWGFKSLAHSNKLWLEEFKNP